MGEKVRQGKRVTHLECQNTQKVRKLLCIRDMFKVLVHDLIVEKYLYFVQTWCFDIFIVYTSSFIYTQNHAKSDDLVVKRSYGVISFRSIFIWIRYEVALFTYSVYIGHT